MMLCRESVVQDPLLDSMTPTATMWTVEEVTRLWLTYKRPHTSRHSYLKPTKNRTVYLYTAYHSNTHDSWPFSRKNDDQPWSTMINWKPQGLWILVTALSGPEDVLLRAAVQTSRDMWISLRWQHKHHSTGTKVWKQATLSSSGSIVTSAKTDWCFEPPDPCCRIDKPHFAQTHHARRLYLRASLRAVAPEHCGGDSHHELGLRTGFLECSLENKSHCLPRFPPG